VYKRDGARTPRLGWTPKRVKEQSIITPLTGNPCVVGLSYQTALVLQVKNRLAYARRLVLHKSLGSAFIIYEQP
jgi:hypothetical protein